METQPITIETTVNASIEKAWKTWTEPTHITKWAYASEDWHTPHATNDLKVGGKFTNRMEAKDGSMGFDFEGIYSEVELYKKISFELEDGRKVMVVFESNGDSTKITETFDPESENPIEMQRSGWQAIIDNFKSYTESI